MAAISLRPPTSKYDSWPVTDFERGLARAAQRFVAQRSLQHPRCRNFADAGLPQKSWYEAGDLKSRRFRPAKLRLVVTSGPPRIAVSLQITRCRWSRNPQSERKLRRDELPDHGVFRATLRTAN